MSAKMLRDIDAPARTLLVSVLVLALTGSSGCAQDDADLEAVSQSSDATVMPNETAVTDLSVTASADTSIDENTTSSIEEMRAKADNVDADGALHANPDDVSPADTDAAASSGSDETANAAEEDGMSTGVESVSTTPANKNADGEQQVTSEEDTESAPSTFSSADTGAAVSGTQTNSTQADGGNAGVDIVDEEPTESVTTTTADGSAADEQNVTSDGSTEPVLNTSSSADTDAVASGSVQIDSTTQAEDGNVGVESENEEPTESVTTGSAGEQDVTSEENAGTATNTFPLGDEEIAKENAAPSVTDAGAEDKFATKEELNYVSNLVIGVQKEMKSIKESSILKKRIIEIQATMDTIRKDLDELRSNALPSPDPVPVPVPVPVPEPVPPSPFTLLQDEDGEPLLMRKGQVAEQYLQELADDGRCQEIGAWLQQSGLELPKRVVFVQKKQPRWQVQASRFRRVERLFKQCKRHRICRFAKWRLKTWV